MGNQLRDFRLSHSLKSQQMVDCVRKFYPKYDKPLQSKCEAEDVYGVQIKPAAMKELYMEFDPEAWAEKHHKDNRQLKNRVQCRLDDVTYAAMKELIAKSGYKTVQDWLAALIKAAIKGGEQC
jgi:hypothetical protein